MSLTPGSETSALMKILAFVITVVAILFGGAAFAGWVLMLLVGVLHHLFDWPTTTISFWQAFGLAFLLSVVRAVLFGNPKASSS